MKRNDIWFVNKRYGYGWTPCTFQGWMITLLYTLFVLIVVILFRPSQHALHEIPLGELALLLIATLLLLGICFLKGERLQWRWGKKNSFTKNS